MSSAWAAGGGRLAGSSGRAALGRALPPYLGIGVAAVVMFGGKWADARSVTNRPSTAALAVTTLAGLRNAGDALGPGVVVACHAQGPHV